MRASGRTHDFGVEFLRTLGCALGLLHLVIERRSLLLLCHGSGCCVREPISLWSFGPVGGFCAKDYVVFDQRLEVCVVVFDCGGQRAVETLTEVVA